MFKHRIKNNFYKVKMYLEKHQGLFSIIFFLVGFLIDNLTLNRIDSIVDILILLTWISLALIFIIIVNYGDYIGSRNKIFNWVYTFAVLIIQFSFGALFSAYVVFYTRSSSFFDSWPFLLFLYFLFIGNEKFRKLYEKFHVQITIFYFSLLFILFLYIPILFKKMNNWIYLLIILLSLVIIRGITVTFFKHIPTLKRMKWKIIRNIVGVLVIFNLFYFNNWLPAIPLSLKDIGVYHYIEKTKDGYVVTDENRKFFSLDNFNNVFHKYEGEKVYLFASIFAPTDFKAKISHMWFRYNDNFERWELKSKVKYNILGGRDNGYRGYSYLTNPEDGEWRVYIVTENNSIVGRTDFEVKTTDKIFTDLITEVKK